MPSQIINSAAPQYVGQGNGNNGQWLRQAEMQVDDYGDDTNHPENNRTNGQSDWDYWPGAGRFMGEAAALMIAPPDHSPRDMATGGNASLGFTGITRDANNAPLAGVTVRLFRTANSGLIQQVVSADDGAYSVQTPYAGEDHFLVCHKSGSPEVAGASVSTLEPS